MLVWSPFFSNKKEMTNGALYDKWCMIDVCSWSCPLEATEDGIIIGDNFSIIEYKAIVVLIVMGHVDDLGLSKLLLQFVHKFDLK